MSVTLITPTHNRHEAFDLCQRWMERQTYTGDIQWIVADGGDVPVVCRLGQEHIRTAPVATGFESFRKNYTAALGAVKHKYVVFIEDDDHYHPDYLKTIVGMLDGGFHAVGQARPRYYNVRHRQFAIHANAINRTSLCQMGVTDASVGPMIKWLNSPNAGVFLDSFFWRHLPYFNVERVSLARNSTHVTGIKGMIGTSGAGIGHNKNDPSMLFDDPTGEMLRNWIGEDAEVYTKYWERPCE